MLILHQNKAIDVNVVRHFTTGSPFYGLNHGIVEHNPFTKQETYWLILFLGKKRTHNVFHSTDQNKHDWLRIFPQFIGDCKSDLNFQLFL